MSWVEIVANVASAIDRVDDGRVLAEALSEAATRGSDAACVSAYGSSAAAFLQALDRSLRAHHLEWPVVLVAQTRALLLDLPTLLDRLDRGSASPERIASVLAHIELLSAQLEPVTSQPRGCRRCGSSRIDVRRTTATGTNLYEQRCDACGSFETWDEGISLGEAMSQTLDASASIGQMAAEDKERKS